MKKKKKKKRELEELLKREYEELKYMTPGSVEYEKLCELILKQEEMLNKKKINGQLVAEFAKVGVSLLVGVGTLILGHKHFRESLNAEFGDEPGSYTSFTTRQVVGDELKRKKLF